jgi:hypothetical protein
MNTQYNIEKLINNGFCKITQDSFDHAPEWDSIVRSELVLDTKVTKTSKGAKEVLKQIVISLSIEECSNYDSDFCSWVVLDPKTLKVIDSTFKLPQHKTLFTKIVKEFKALKTPKK